MEPRILIIIVTYNSENYIERCLFSIANQNYKAFTLFVIDNASADRTAEIVKNYRNAESRISPLNFRFIRLNKNIGFAGAVNLVVFKSLKYKRYKEQNYNFILLLNPDMVLDDFSIHNLVNVFSSNEQQSEEKRRCHYNNIGAAGGLILEYDHDNIQHLGGFVLPNFVTFHNDADNNIDIKRIINNDIKYIDSLKKIKPDYVTGALFMTPFNLFAGIGGFDSGYRPAYFEELDYCLKIKRAGFKIAIEPSALARHFEGASTGKFSKKFYYYYHKNRIRCAIINSGFKDLLRIIFYWEPRWLKTKATRDQKLPLLKAYMINSLFYFFYLLLKVRNIVRISRVKQYFKS